MLIDKDTIDQARNADIITFFQNRHGFTFAHRGAAYRCKQHPSLAVKNDRLSFYWHSKSVGGFGVLDYLIKIENMSFRDAVEAVIGATVTPVPLRQEMRQPKSLVLPETAANPLRLYDYLCNKRGIDGEIVNLLIQEKRLYEDKRGNTVFIGYDEHDKPRFASLRGTYGDCAFRMDCTGSDKRYGFCMAAETPCKRLYIFESAIDAMSHASIENIITGDINAWKRDSRLSLSGTADTALQFFLNKQNAINELVFCLDNDPAGREAAVSMARKYAEKGYYTRLELPTGKDVNEDLQTLTTERSMFND